MIKLLSSPERVARCHSLLCLCAMASSGESWLIMDNKAHG